MERRRVAYQSKQHSLSAANEPIVIQPSSQTCFEHRPVFEVQEEEHDNNSEYSDIVPVEGSASATLLTIGEVDSIIDPLPQRKKVPREKRKWYKFWKKKPKPEPVYEKPVETMYDQTLPVDDLVDFEVVRGSSPKTSEYMDTLREVKRFKLVTRKNEDVCHFADWKSHMWTGDPSVLRLPVVKSVEGARTHTRSKYNRRVDVEGLRQARDVGREVYMKKMLSGEMDSVLAKVEVYSDGPKVTQTKPWELQSIQHIKQSRLEGRNEFYGVRRESLEENILEKGNDIDWIRSRIQDVKHSDGTLRPRFQSSQHRELSQPIASVENEVPVMKVAPLDPNTVDSVFIRRGQTHSSKVSTKEEPTIEEYNRESNAGSIERSLFLPPLRHDSLDWLYEPNPLQDMLDRVLIDKVLAEEEPDTISSEYSIDGSSCTPSVTSEHSNSTIELPVETPAETQDVPKVRRVVKRIIGADPIHSKSREETRNQLTEILGSIKNLDKKVTVLEDNGGHILPKSVLEMLTKFNHAREVREISNDTTVHEMDTSATGNTKEDSAINEHVEPEIAVVEIETSVKKAKRRQRKTAVEKGSTKVEKKKKRKTKKKEAVIVETKEERRKKRREKHKDAREKLKTKKSSKSKRTKKSSSETRGATWGRSCGFGNQWLGSVWSSIIGVGVWLITEDCVDELS